VKLLAVLIGGALGAASRYGVGIYVAKWQTHSNIAVNFPLATLLVNVVGSFCLALLFFMRLEHLSPILKLGIATGFLGALTTFSTFELESFVLLEKGRIIQAMLYILGNLVLGMLAVLLARSLALSLK